MKVIIAGGRNYSDYDQSEFELNLFLDSIMQKGEEITVLSGACDRGTHTFTREDGTKVYGADGIGERYAKMNGYKVEYFPAKWDKFGLSAGPIRNGEMAKQGTHAVIFWDGNSRGTCSIIMKCKKGGLNVKVINY